MKIIIETPIFDKNLRIEQYNILYRLECIKEVLKNNENLNCKKVFVYYNLGINKDMEENIKLAIKNNIEVEFKSLENFEYFNLKNKELINCIIKQNETDFINDFLKTY